jgi:glycosyltransferase involved in cell wall biosynthesis
MPRLRQLRRDRERRRKMGCRLCRVTMVQGKTAHRGLDIGVAAEPVRRFLKRFPGWDLQLNGTDYRPTFNTNTDRMFYEKWIQVNKDAPGYYRAIDFDIGLAPLVPAKFTASKSALKALEYNARGIPVIATDCEPYRDYVKDGINGFLVKYDHQWLSYLSELASDDALREKMSTAARETARAWTIEDGWKPWARAYEGLFK